MAKATDTEYNQNLDDARRGLQWGVFFCSRLHDQNVCVAMFLNKEDAETFCSHRNSKSFTTYFVAEASETFRLKRAMDDCYKIVPDHLK